jgi:hypothetical protein
MDKIKLFASILIFSVFYSCSGNPDQAETVDSDSTLQEVNDNQTDKRSNKQCCSKTKKSCKMNPDKCCMDENCEGDCGMMHCCTLENCEGDCGRKHCCTDDSCKGDCGIML